MRTFCIATAATSRRWLLVTTLAVAMIGAALCMPAPAAAQAGVLPTSGSEGETSETPPVTLPEHLTREEVRVLMSRLSDQEVRQLLLQQLDAVAEQEAAVAAEPQDVMDRLEEALPAVKNRINLMVAAIPELSSIGSFLLNKLTNDQPSRIWIILIYTAVIFAGGVAAEWLLRRLFSRGIQHPEDETASVLDKVCLLGMRLMVDLVGIGVFALGALGLFFVFYQGHEPLRLTIGTVFWVIVWTRIVAALARFALAPRLPALRLPPVDDSAAMALYRRIVWISAAIIVAVLVGDLFENLQLEEGLFLLCDHIIGFLIVCFLIGIIWHDRHDIAGMIRSGRDGTEEAVGPVKRIFAANWHILATFYLVGIYVLSQAQMLVAGARTTGASIASVFVLVAIPFVDWMMRAGLKRLLRKPAKAAEDIPTEMAEDNGEVAVAASEPDEEANEYFNVLLKNLRMVLGIIVIVALAEVWNIDLQGAAASGVGETVANSIFDIVITLVLASAIWGIVKTAISQKLPKKRTGGDASQIEGEAGGAGGTRLETLLPLFQKFLFVTLIVIVTLIVLSELGVDIGPLIAGAGIVGIAIGFGAQTLVRDIVSGVFFLIEDAFRVGEYIQVGTGARGMVEDISIRSLRLRHHNGPIHTIPFGDVGTLTNYSRDWVIMKLEMRLPFETDIEKVRKIVKRVGQDMMADEELGKNLLQPVKSQGVNRMDDSAFIFRVKFMAKPGEQFVLRREVYRRVQEALAEQGIHFAPKRVIVDTSGMTPEQAVTAAAAAADDTPTGARGETP